MLIKPTTEDFSVVGFNLGRISTLVGIAGLVPLLWAVILREWAPAFSFILMIGVFVAMGALGQRIKTPQHRLDWSHGMVVVALAWLLVPAFASIPLALSGHYGSLIDAVFDAMSGLSTTGLALVQDLDHLASSLNFWRHLLHFLGGQGIIIAALSIFAGGGVVTLYLGEARDERILPSVRSTARFIWAAALMHLGVGVVVLTLVAWQVLGFSFMRSLFHGLMVFFAAFDTGGFAAQSTNLGYYHSTVFEFVAAVLMVAGTMSFGVHYALWKRRYGAVMLNLETRTMLVTFGLTLLATIVGLAATGAFTETMGLTRYGFFQLLSAHTGTGFATVSVPELAGWSGLAFAGMAMAMSLGGMGSSTAGGVKSLRVGITVRSIIIQIKQVLVPEGALVSRSYHQNGKIRLTPGLAQAAMTVSLLYVALYLAGAGMALMYGYGLGEAFFESISAGANVGLSVGITDPTMPLLLKLTYIGQMWLGRLEFVAVFALFGFLYSTWRGK
ncbi:MAG: potassium transporter TrkG [Acidimicrobiia bacterium]|nr:potassium transporter TrkG [Acidimicrobiia bacterium]MDX2467623.1 potassium transporter TrkG [Acidimicrobiia bacterium]